MLIDLWAFRVLNELLFKTNFGGNTVAKVSLQLFESVFLLHVVKIGFSDIERIMDSNPGKLFQLLMFFI